MPVEDVLVVGAGIVGLLCALELQQRGARVTVLDAGSQRPSASWAGGGILSPLFPWRYPDSVTALTRHARRDYRLWCARVREEVGIEVELNECGMFVLERPGEQALHWARSHDVNLKPSLLADECPGWPEVAGAWLPDVSTIRNPQMLAGLRELARHRGVVLRQGVAEQVRVDEAEVLTREGPYRAGHLILAAGQWNQMLVGDLLEPGLLFPVRGQMLLYRLQPGELPAILLSEDGYLIPRQDGLVLAGSTLEPGISDSLPTEDGARQLASMASELMPGLSRYQPVAQWAGVRPGCARPQPLIRPLDAAERSWLVGGHYRNGLVAAPGTARLLAEQLNREPAFIDPAPYR